MDIGRAYQLLGERIDRRERAREQGLTVEDEALEIVEAIIRGAGAVVVKARDFRGAGERLDVVPNVHDAEIILRLQATPKAPAESASR